MRTNSGPSRICAATGWNIFGDVLEYLSWSSGLRLVHCHRAGGIAAQLNRPRAMGNEKQLHPRRSHVVAGPLFFVGLLAALYLGFHSAERRLHNRADGTHLRISTPTPTSTPEGEK